MRWRTLSSKVVYRNSWLQVREDAVLRPDGEQGIYGVVSTNSPAVFIVAISEREEIVLVTQDRYTTGTESIEVPAGATDGQEPLEAAKRELYEEAGMEAASWHLLGTLESMNGICSEHALVYLATQLSVAERAPQSNHDGITGVQTVPLQSAFQMIRRGEITDGQTVSSLALAALHLGRLR